jgi:hypothetical protein
VGRLRCLSSSASHADTALRPPARTAAISSGCRALAVSCRSQSLDRRERGTQLRCAVVAVMSPACGAGTSRRDLRCRSYLGLAGRVFCAREQGTASRCPPCRRMRGCKPLPPLILTARRRLQQGALQSRVIAHLVTHERRDLMDSSAFPSPILPPVRAAQVRAIPHIIGGLTPIRSPPAIHTFGTPCHQGPHSRAGPSKEAVTSFAIQRRRRRSAESPSANGQVQLSARTSCATDNSTSNGDRHAHDSVCACRSILAATA